MQWAVPLPRSGVDACLEPQELPHDLHMAALRSEVHGRHLVLGLLRVRVRAGLEQGLDDAEGALACSDVQGQRVVAVLMLVVGLGLQQRPGDIPIVAEGDRGQGREAPAKVGARFGRQQVVDDARMPLQCGHLQGCQAPPALCVRIALGGQQHLQAHFGAVLRRVAEHHRLAHICGCVGQEDLETPPVVEAASRHTGNSHLAKVTLAVRESLAQAPQVVHAHGVLQGPVLGAVALEYELAAVPDLPQHRHVEAPHLLPDLPWDCHRGGEAHGLEGEVVVADVAAEVGPEVCPLSLVCVVVDKPIQPRAPEGHGLHHLAPAHGTRQRAEAPPVQLPQVLVNEDLPLLHDPLQHLRRHRAYAQPDEALQVRRKIALLRQGPKQQHARVGGVRVEERLWNADHEPEGADDLDAHDCLQQGQGQLEEAPRAALRERDRVPQGHVVLGLHSRGVVQLPTHHQDVSQYDATQAGVAAHGLVEGLGAHLHSVPPAAGTPVRRAEHHVRGEHTAEADCCAQVAMVCHQDQAGDDVHKGLHGKGHEFYAPPQPQKVPLARCTRPAGADGFHHEVQALRNRRPERLYPPLDRLLVAVEVWESAPDPRRLRALPDVQVVAPQHAVPVKVRPQHPGREPLVVRGAVVGHPFAHSEHCACSSVTADLVAV
mmetsp:Transcript_79277/g.232860  ORF Transcript_79277/g.232860 Transcript_79277/m.232860 type:complete len:657 (-) Transcript_79277:215-2185(-)